MHFCFLQGESNHVKAKLEPRPDEAREDSLREPRKENYDERHTADDDDDDDDDDADSTAVTSICKKFGNELSFCNASSLTPFTLALPFQKVRTNNTTVIIVLVAYGLRPERIKVHAPGNKSLVISYGVKTFPKDWFDPTFLYRKERVQENAFVWASAFRKQQENKYNTCAMTIQLDYHVALKDIAIICRRKTGEKYISIELSELSEV
jgi:hypothetical protein